MIDLHSHVLPGIDDGPASVDGSREILEAAAADGITHIAATPHVRDDHPTTPEQMEEAVAQATRCAGSVSEVTRDCSCSSSRTAVGRCSCAT